MKSFVEVTLAPALDTAVLPLPLTAAAPAAAAAAAAIAAGLSFACDESVFIAFD